MYVSQGFNCHYFDRQDMQRKRFIKTLEISIVTSGKAYQRSYTLDFDFLAIYAVAYLTWGRGAKRPPEKLNVKPGPPFSLYFCIDYCFGFE